MSDFDGTQTELPYYYNTNRIMIMPHYTACCWQQSSLKRHKNVPNGSSPYSYCTALHSASASVSLVGIFLNCRQTQGKTHPSNKIPCSKEEERVRQGSAREWLSKWNIKVRACLWANESDSEYIREYKRKLWIAAERWRMGDFDYKIREQKLPNCRLNCNCSGFMTLTVLVHVCMCPQHLIHTWFQYLLCLFTCCNSEGLLCQWLKP